MEIDDKVLKTIIDNNFPSKKKINIPIMINYSPVSEISVKPLMLVLVYENGNISLGYTWYRNFKEIVKTIKMSTLIEMLEQDTFVKQMSLGISEIPSRLEDYISNRKVEYVNIIGNSESFGIDALNFVTTDFKGFTELCENPHEIEDVIVRDKLVMKCIDMQSSLDAFMHFVTTFTMNTSNFSKLNNSIINSVEIYTYSPLRTLMRSMRGREFLDEVDKRMIELTPNNPTQISVPIYGELVGVHTRITDRNQASLLEVQSLRYNVVGLAILSEDFGEGGISGLPKYIQTNNALVEALMVNSNMYSSIIEKNSNLMYNRRMTEINITGNINTYEFDNLGKYKFSEVLQKLSG